jgi:hypothetical protein
MEAVIRVSLGHKEFMKGENFPPSSMTTSSNPFSIKFLQGILSLRSSISPLTAEFQGICNLLILFDNKK